MTLFKKKLMDKDKMVVVYNVYVDGMDQETAENVLSQTRDLYKFDDSVIVYTVPVYDKSQHGIVVYK